MTKGGSGKPKTLGRLIFGEKRKQHASPTRRRSTTGNTGSAVDLPASVGVVPTTKTPINIHDWAIWRMQLNEKLESGLTDRRTELKQLRQFLQTNPFYQQYSRDPSSGRFNGVRLLFSIPRAKFRSELVDGSQGGIITTNTNEVGEDTTPCQPKKVRSNSEENPASVTSASAAQPAVVVVDKTISQLFSKGLVENTGGFLQVNEQMIAADVMRTRRTGRSSFKASDRIHSTLQKAVKDGNVLEKIKAFEMQAAAAQAESAMKLGGLNHRMQTVTSSLQSAAHRTLSPAIIHPISPIPIQQPIRSSRDYHVHPVQHRRDTSHGPIIGHESRKGAHVLEPAHGDIILKRRTPSQKTMNDEDYSITAISSVGMTTSQGHPHHRSRHHHQQQQQQQQQHRTSVSRSKHRQEMPYEKRPPSNHEIPSHKHQQKPKRTTTPLTKTSTRRRWLKGRKETPTETSLPTDKPEVPIVKSNKSKKKTAEHEKNNSKKGSTTDLKGKSSSDNNRVYGVPKAETSEHIKLDSPSPKIDEKGESDVEKDNTNTYMAPKEVEIIHPKTECEKISVTKIPRRSSKKHHQQKLSSTDGEILSKVDENTRLSHPIDDYPHHHSAINDESDGDVFLVDSPTKPSSNITRHQSIVNLPNHESRRFQRHTSQCSAEELAPTTHRRYQRSTENLLKKKSLPLTIITRKNTINQDEQNVYETPHSEQVQTSICHTHTMKKKRPCHTMIATGGGGVPSNGQTNNKQISKQILHAIMNSMNNSNQEQSTKPPGTPSVYDEFFENGPLTNPEETLTNTTAST